MKKHPREVQGDRRAFFRAVAGVGVLAGTGAVILRTSGGALSGARSPAADAVPNAGYRETDHIRKYYETARR